MASEIRFAEIRKLLEQNGWTLGRISASHHIFEKPALISIPVHHGKVKPAYVRKAQKAIEEN
ncbi:MAG TPA: type II toxin-antitoxin system HicA family toxin [Tepidisphaeraceae bacterium]|jgi:predicted RNA binding protein YcfA (HicA-like mRNA interferase family)|nr:type II toxin-antitoxin system HicA family toxin [Tepidisphaeraceae bacterium]